LEIENYDGLMCRVNFERVGTATITLTSKPCQISLSIFQKKKFSKKSKNLRIERGGDSKVPTSIGN